jgi:LmbE family N-acetylglucosaminyl deacetylase
MNILVIAAHPDDEVLGMGGTIKKLSKNNIIHLCVVSEGVSAQYQDRKMMKIRKDSCVKSSKILGIHNIDFLDFPDMKLDSIPHLEINQNLEKIIKKFKPNTVFTTPFHDLNKDHELVFESTLVATRPGSSNVKRILSYEMPGISKIPFKPNTYSEISKHMKWKIKAFNQYKSEIHEFPHSRSIKAIENLAIQRGVESGLGLSESFYLIRGIE